LLDNSKDHSLRNQSNQLKNNILPYPLFAFLVLFAVGCSNSDIKVIEFEKGPFTLMDSIVIPDFFERDIQESNKFFNPKSEDDFFIISRPLQGVLLKISADFKTIDTIRVTHNIDLFGVISITDSKVFQIKQNGMQVYDFSTLADSFIPLQNANRIGNTGYMNNGITPYKEFYLLREFPNYPPYKTWDSYHKYLDMFGYHVIDGEGNNKGLMRYFDTILYDKSILSKNAQIGGVNVFQDSFLLYDFSELNQVYLVDGNNRLIKKIPLASQFEEKQVPLTFEEYQNTEHRLQKGLEMFIYQHLSINKQIKIIYRTSFFPIIKKINETGLKSFKFDAPWSIVSRKYNQSLNFSNQKEIHFEAKKFDPRVVYYIGDRLILKKYDFTTNNLTIYSYKSDLY